MLLEEQSNGREYFLSYWVLHKNGTAEDLKWRNLDGSVWRTGQLFGAMHVKDMKKLVCSRIAAMIWQREVSWKKI